jgi:hypothetical protein
MTMATNLGDGVIGRNVRVDVDIDDAFWQEDVSRGEGDVGGFVCCAGYFAAGAAVGIACVAMDAWA